VALFFNRARIPFGFQAKIRNGETGRIASI
jgi:hypothetical protein